MTQEELAALLGRPLTPTEITNFDLYLEIAEESLEDLICTPIVTDVDTRKFPVREGYKTAFIDIFTELTEVKLNDTVISDTDYTVMQWDKYSGSWYNSIVFEDYLCENDVLEVTGSWGFAADSGAGSDLPVGLQSVLAGLFAAISKRNKFDATVEKKDVEDFSITFNTDADLDDEFFNKYKKTLSKYSLCNIPYVKHGDLNCGC